MDKVIDEINHLRSRIRRITMDMEDLDGRVRLEPAGYMLANEDLAPYYENAIPVTRATARQMGMLLEQQRSAIHSEACQTLWVHIEWARANNWSYLIEASEYGGHKITLISKAWEGAADRKYAPSHMHWCNLGLSDQDKQIWRRWHDDLRVSYHDGDSNDLVTMDEETGRWFVHRQMRAHGDMVTKLLIAANGGKDPGFPMDFENDGFIRLTDQYYANVVSAYFNTLKPSKSLGFQLCTTVYIAGDRETPPEEDEVNIGDPVPTLWGAAALAVKQEAYDKAHRELMELHEGLYDDD